MVIFYKNPNTLTLPYTLTVVAGVDGKEIRKIQHVYKFVPGTNYLDKDVWLAIVKQHENDMEYYSTMLKIFQPKLDRETKQLIGEDEKNIDIKKLASNDFAELIDNTMELEKLNKYFIFEKNKQEPRKFIIQKIIDRKEEIEELEEVIRKSKEE
jgi:hypothetical protein